MKSGIVFYYAQEALEEGSLLISWVPIPNCGPVHEQNTHEQLLLPPEIRRPVAPVANWRVFCRTNY